MKTKVLIIGGGIAGLYLANLLAEQRIDFHLAEARDRFGGRMLVEKIEEHSFDLGPAWFWAGQPRMASLASAHAIKVFEQYAEGDLTYENELGQVQRGRGFSSVQGSLRLNGGFGALIDAIAKSLPSHSISLDTTVVRLSYTGQTIIAKTNQSEIHATNVVLAVPPRIAAKLISFDPQLPPAAFTALQSVPTWMAGQAKALAVYDTPFWREDGLSGDASSRRGPMVEIHDASPMPSQADTPLGALFGFIGVPPQSRKNEAALRDAILSQFERLFGPKAANPKSLILKDWAFDQFTATDLDLAPLSAHPDYGMPPALKNLWDNKLIFANTETASQFGGYAEGALEAAEAAFKTITDLLPPLV
jgi:monoamine oxidase